MKEKLSAIEVRILGALIEKKMTTPAYYPLSVNALCNACNQKSNRSPVTDYTEAQIENTLEKLRDKGWVRSVTGTGRVVRYKHILGEKLGLSSEAVALMAVLMLRGAQTVGELRSRTERMHAFESLAQVEETLDVLSNREPEALVIKLARMPGQKEARYLHLLKEDAKSLEAYFSAMENAPQEPETAAPVDQADKLTALENEVANLRSALEKLTEEFETFRQQFE